MTTLKVPDGPKMLRETLCVAQSRIGNSPLDAGRRMEHIYRLQRLIDECDRHRPIGPDGKHGNRHTRTCGCDKPTLGRRFRVWLRRKQAERDKRIGATDA